MSASRIDEVRNRRIEAVTQALFASPNIGVALTSPEKGWIDANDTLCEMSGYTREELFGISWLDLSYPDDLPADLVQFNRLLAGEIDRYSLDKRFIRKDGSLIWAMITVSCVRRAGGGVDFVIGLIQDVTARKQAEEAHKEAESRFRQLANELPVAIYQTAANGDLIFVNPAWLGLTGLTRAEAFAPGAGMVIHPDDREYVRARWEHAISSGTVFSEEYRLRPRHGRETWVKGFGSAVRDATGKVVSFVGALVDVSEIRRLHAEVAQRSRLAAMGTLVAGVAHEINNPLAAMLTNQGLALELIREAQSEGARAAGTGGETLRPDDVVEMLTESLECGKRVAQIVKDMACFASPGPQRARTRLGDVARSAIRWLPASVKDGARIRVEATDAPEVMAASGQLEQVVQNLLANAVKASPDGVSDPIVVRIGEGSTGKGRLEVVDHGCGIPEHLQDRIFDPFFTTRRGAASQGSGLGLAISRSIVTAHGGTLTVESAVGKGSTFRMELPAAPSEA